MADYTKTILHELPADTAHTENDDYRLVPGASYTFNLSGGGSAATWQYHNGTTYVDFPSPGAENFTGDITGNGLVRLNWDSGTVLAGFVKNS